MSKFYEVYVPTSLDPESADSLIKALNKKNCVDKPFRVTGTDDSGVALYLERDHFVTNPGIMGKLFDAIRDSGISETTIFAWGVSEISTLRPGAPNWDTL